MAAAKSPKPLTPEKALEAAIKDAAATAPNPATQKAILSALDYDGIAALAEQDIRAVVNLVIHNASSVINGWNTLHRTDPKQVEEGCPTLIGLARTLGIGTNDWAVQDLERLITHASERNFLRSDKAEGSFSDVMVDLANLACWNRHNMENRREIVYEESHEALPSGVTLDPRSESAADIQYRAALQRNARGVFNTLAANLSSYPPAYAARTLWHVEPTILMQLAKEKKYQRIIGTALYENASHVIAGIHAYYMADPRLAGHLPQDMDAVLYDYDQARAWMMQELTRQPADGRVIELFIIAGYQHHQAVPNYMANLQEEKRQLRDAQDARLAEGSLLELGALCTLLCTIANRSHKNLTAANPELHFRYHAMHYPWAVPYDASTLDAQRIVIKMEHTPLAQDFLTRVEGMDAGAEKPSLPSLAKLEASLQQYNVELNDLLRKAIAKLCKKKGLPMPLLDSNFGFRTEMFNDRNVSLFGTAIVLHVDHLMGGLKGLGERDDIFEELYAVARGLRGNVDKPILKPFQLANNLVAHYITDPIAASVSDRIMDAVLSYPRTLRDYLNALLGIAYQQLDPGADFSRLKTGEVYAPNASHPLLGHRAVEHRVLGGEQNLLGGGGAPRIRG